MTATATDHAPTGERTTTRVPPQDTDAEKGVLGAMLLSKDAIGDAVGILRADDFYQPRHTAIFTAICNLFDEDIAVDAVVLADRLVRTGAINKIGGAAYLHDLVAGVPIVESVGYYADIVADLAQKRRVIEAAGRAAGFGWAPDLTGAESLDRAQQALHDADGRRDTNGISIMGELMQASLDEIEGASQGGQSGVPTGFADLDRLLNGLHAGQLVVMAGRPGLGKSTAAMDFSRAASIKHNMASAIFSLEMSKLEIMLRLLSAEARVPLAALRSGKLTDDDWTKLARRMGEISEAPLFVDDTPNMTLMEIRAKARRLKQRHDLKLIVVDYLQLMTSPKRTESRQQEVADLSRGLKLLAKEVECPVVAVSQLNRNSEQRTDKRPLLSDLRESGSIEQDADVVILLHRDDYYDKESPRAGEADFIVAKHRNGPTDTVTVAAQLHLSRFVDMAI